MKRGVVGYRRKGKDAKKRGRGERDGWKDEREGLRKEARKGGRAEERKEGRKEGRGEDGWIAGKKEWREVRKRKEG